MKPANAQAEVAAPGRRRSRPADRPVFVAEHRRRERAVRAVLVLLGALLLAWLVALIAGALGLGSLPPLPVSGGGDAGSASSSQSAPPPASARVAPDKGADATGSSVAARPEGQPGSAPTPTGGPHRPKMRRRASSPARRRLAPRRQGGTGGVRRPGRTGNRPARLAAGRSPTGTPVRTAGSGAAEAPSQPAAAHGPPAVAPSGNEVPVGSASGPSAKAEAIEESPGGAHRATETGRPG